MMKLFSASGRTGFGYYAGIRHFACRHSRLVGWPFFISPFGFNGACNRHRIDPGWSGNIVLEFYNSGRLPLALRPNMKIGALNFETMTGEAARPYNKRVDAKYQQQTGAVASRISQDDPKLESYCTQK